MKRTIAAALLVLSVGSLSSCGLIGSALGMTQRTVRSVTRTITGDANEAPYLEPPTEDVLAEGYTPRELTALSVELEQTRQPVVVDHESGK